MSYYSVDQVVEMCIRAEHRIAKNFFLATFEEFAHSMNQDVFADELAECVIAMIGKYPLPAELAQRFIERLASAEFPEYAEEISETLPEPAGEECGDDSR